MKYRIGDLVKITEPESNWIGKTATILELDDSDDGCRVWVDAAGTWAWVDEGDLEPIHSDLPTWEEMADQIVAWKQGLFPLPLADVVLPLYDLAVAIEESRKPKDKRVEVVIDVLSNSRALDDGRSALAARIVAALDEAES